MASLMGTYYHNIDAKGRMNFPTKLREILGTTFYVTKGLDQPCLTVCSAAEGNALPQKWLPFRNPRADSFGGGSFRELVF